MKKKHFLLSFILFLATSSTIASHLRGGNISVSRTSQSQYAIKLKVYVRTINDGAQVLFSNGNSGILDFGDGTSKILNEEAGEVRYDLNPDGSIGYVEVLVSHSYNTGSYHVTYTEASRNNGIMNFDDSGFTPFYLECYFVYDATGDYQGTPDILAPPIFKAVVGQDFSDAVAANDPNDYTLYYYLITPRQSKTENVSGYVLPENFAINEFTGQIIWNTKFKNEYHVGEYLFSIKILQVKNGIAVGYTIQDVQINLVDGLAETTLTSNISTDTNGRIYVPTGTTYTLKVFAEDANAESLDLAVYSNYSLEAEPSFSFVTSDSVTSDSRKIKVGLLKLKSITSLVRDNPYEIIVRASYATSFKLFKDMTFLLYTKDVELPHHNLMTGITSDNDLNVKVSPNPVADFLTIKNVRTQDMNVKIFSISAELVYQKKHDQDIVVDMKSFPSGLYFVKVNQGNQQKIIKVIKN